MDLKTNDNLIRLLYCISISDNDLHPKEVVALQKYIKKTGAVLDDSTECDIPYIISKFKKEDKDFILSTVRAVIAADGMMVSEEMDIFSTLYDHFEDCA
jgi:hypothetical protein